MTHEIILKLITTITIFCTQHGATVDYSNQCLKKIWTCGHNVTTPSAIPSKTHNCITKYLDGKL